MSEPRWPRADLLALLPIELPIIQAPMAGAGGVELALAAASAGALGSLPCAMLAPDALEQQLMQFRTTSEAPVNLNFFCHEMPAANTVVEQRWRETLAAYYAEFEVAPPSDPGTLRQPFDEAMCELVERLLPEVVSFHFGLPAAGLLQRVQDAGITVLSSATTVAEARWLAERGVDAVIAQGAEAGGHRGMFLTEDLLSQQGTLALLPQVVDAVDVPVIAAGGIADGRGIAACFALGAAGVQLGTAYLFTPQATVSSLHRDALAAVNERGTALTNVFSGRPARGVVNRLVAEQGPVSAAAPAFPLAGSALVPLRDAALAAGSADFSPLWSGQAAALGAPEDAADLTRRLAEDALDCMAGLAGGAG